MITGSLKFFNRDKGYGFITPDNGDKDVFVHITALTRAKILQFEEGDKFSFDIAKDVKTGKDAASNVRKLKA